MKKILVIDYDQAALASLQGILSKEGYQVITAGDGQAGWDKYNQESPDLVLMEAMLPKIHGFELCQRITSERNSQAIVFIMTGVYKDRVYRTEALRTYGASEYFEKPLKMAELLASIQAVLGKPEPKPVEKPAPAKPVREVQLEPVLVSPRKVEKLRPAAPEPDWSVDLEKMRREIPKTRIPGPAHLEPSLETRLESIADELFKKTVAEPVQGPKTVDERLPTNGDHDGNGHESNDIDKFLKSALADLDLKNERVRVPKTTPLPPPLAAEAPKAAPAAGPVGEFSQPAEPRPSSSLTPGDPGSDVSPFFTPPKPKPDKSRDFATVPRPARQETKAREATVIASSLIFSDVAGTKDKKGFPPLIAVGVGIAIIAALGFFILKPKKPAGLSVDASKSRQAVTQPAVTEKSAEDVNPPEAKPKPTPDRPKVQTQTRVTNIGPSSEEAILLPGGLAGAPPLSGGGQAAGGDASKAQGAADSTPVQTDPPPDKAEENPPQSTASAPGTAALTPAAPLVNEGDLVDLASVTEPPRTLKTVDPLYPQQAQRLRVEGSITVNALIDEKGNVIDTGILKGIQDDSGLHKAVELAVRKWKFQPARKNGVNVKVWKPFVIVFKALKKQTAG